MYQIIVVTPLTSSPIFFHLDDSFETHFLYFFELYCSAFAYKSNFLLQM